MRKLFSSTLLVLSVFILFGNLAPDSLFADDGEYLDFCIKKDTAWILYQDLIDIQEQDNLPSLWNDLWEQSDQETTASRAVSLVDQMIPGGDLSRIITLDGFIEIPGNDEGSFMVSRQVMAIEAAFLAIPALVEMNEPSSLWLAQSLFKELKKSSDVKLVMEIMDAEQYSKLNFLMSQSKELYRLYRGEIEFTFFETELFDIVKAGRNIESSSKNGAVPLDKDGKISFSNPKYGWEWNSGKIVKWDSVAESFPEGADEGKADAGGDCGG